MLCPSDFGSAWRRAEASLLADLRTPRSAYDSFLRAVLRRQPDTLWRTVHPDLRFYLKRLYLREGAALFFERLLGEIAVEGRTPRLGEPEDAGPGRLTCALLHDGVPVGVAGFALYDGGWMVSLLA